MGHRARLAEDLIRFCEQMGINPVPRLYVDRNAYNEFRKSIGYRRSRKNAIGECDKEDSTIFVDVRMKYYSYYKYFTPSYTKRTNVRARTHRVIATYREKRNCLVHELVHYKWSIPHGLKFEQRIKDIIAGRRFD